MSTSAPAAGGASPRREIAIPGRSGYLRCPSGRTLFCVSHAPEAVPPRGTVVLWQACSEERKASHRTLVRLASRLAEAGYTTHRIDLPGCGESSGNLATLRLADWRADATFAATTLLPEADATAWIGGLRMGATVAGLLELPTTPAARWLGIAPIVSGSAWLRQLRTRRSIRSELTTAATPDAAGAAPSAAGAVQSAASAAAIDPAAALSGGEDFDGFRVGSGLLGDLEQLHLATALQRRAGAVVQAGPSTSITREFQPLAETAPGLHMHAVRQEPVWERGESVNDEPLIAAVLKALTAQDA